MNIFLNNWLCIFCFPVSITHSLWIKTQKQFKTWVHFKIASQKCEQPCLTVSTSVQSQQNNYLVSRLVQNQKNDYQVFRLVQTKQNNTFLLVQGQQATIHCFKQNCYEQKRYNYSVSDCNSDFSSNLMSDSDSGCHSDSSSNSMNLVIFVSFILYLHSSKYTCG